MLGLDLTNGEIRTIIWATGFRPDYSWLDVDVLDGKGMIRHDGGVVESPGMYLIGMPFLRRRKSSFIDGAREDAEDLIVELAAFLDRRAASGRNSRGTRAERQRLVELLHLRDVPTLVDDLDRRGLHHGEGSRDPRTVRDEAVRPPAGTD